MPGKLHNRHSSSRCSLKFLIFALFVALIVYVIFSFAWPSVTYSVQTTRTERSFVTSLEHFLINKAPKLSLPVRDDTVRGESDHLARELDDVVFERENRLLNEDPVGIPVKVYVYEMPKKFTYDLLWLFQNTYKETSNLTSNGSPVHRLIEQHSIDYWLWADLIDPESVRRLKSAVRVHQQQDADIFYVPFFTTISFFLLEKQQCKALYREALKWITDQPAWKRSEGRDHVLPIHHPWSFKSVRKYVKNAIWLLPDLDSTGNWYKPGQVSLEKDLILPYVPNVDLCDAKCLSENSSKRTTLLFFRGRLKRNAGGKVRAKLGAELSSAKDVIITEGIAGDEGKLAAQKGMRRSLFCLCPAGDTPSSARLFDAIVSGCIPVVVSDELELPFEGLLDYRKIAVIISSGDATQPGWLVNHLRSLSPSHIKGLQKNLAQYSRHFLYSNPAQPLGPEDLTWRMISGKVVNMKLHTRRSQRMVKGSRSICRCDSWQSNSTVSSPLTRVLLGNILRDYIKRRFHLHPDTLEVLSLCCESMPMFKNLKMLIITSDEDRGWQAMPVLLWNCPQLENLLIKGLVHHVTDKCGDACDCIRKKYKGRSLKSCPVKSVCDSRVYRNNERDEHDRAFLGLFSLFE